ncbi:MAG: hypothetical protein ACTSRP_04935 [Candidatus Helarchaeota archaeon]
MIHIAFLLHIYQPPCQDYKILRKIIAESYIPFLNVIKNTKNAKITLNITGSLTELLVLYGFNEVLSIINELSIKDRIHFTGTGMYHPILPLLPKVEAERQIELNEKFNSGVFEKFSKEKGFFPPELSISKGVLNLINLKGYKWTIADGVACSKEWPTDKYYSYKNTAIFFRDSIISNQIAFKEITPSELIERLKNLFEQDYYVIFAMDGETFGHHIKGYEITFLKNLFDLVAENEEFEFVFIDDLLKLYTNGGEIVPYDSSWSTSYFDIQNEVPYPLWANPNNRLHIIQNRLQDLVYDLLMIAENEMDLYKDNESFMNIYSNARNQMDKGELSCKLWWSCPEHFDYNLIINGNQFLIKSALASYNLIMKLDISRQLQNECRKLYENILAEYQFLLHEIGTLFEYKYKFGHL